MKSEDSSQKFRMVEVNRPQRRKYPSNRILTAKYNLISFLPLFLLNQFSNYSNLFFLVISILQQLPGVSPMGKYTTILPLSIILTISGIKELYEDIVRHREDKKINARKVEQWTTSGWTTVQWKQIKVGEILRVKENFEFPADLVMLCCSNGGTGIAYVETVNLDGENNLKVRRVPHSLHVDEANLHTLAGTIKCDHPNELIYSFNGMVVLPNGVKISINEEQLLLREATLRNTDWVIGIVVYTGTDTKIWRNSEQRQMKRSSSEDMINWHMMVLFTIFFLLTICNSILYIIFSKYHIRETIWYLPNGMSNSLTYSTFLTFAIGYSTIIPISLQIYLEVARLVQANYINRDEKLYNPHSQTYAQVRSSNLNSDLGQVKYIFSDKTGTLTQNILEFKECSIQGTVYNASNIEMIAGLCEKDDVCHNFFIAICVAPGVIPIFSKTTRELKYYSSSTDQLALIRAAQNFGYELRQRTYRDADVSVQGTIHKYEILGDIEFTNERRRTSVVVRTPKNKIILYVMGADDVIFQRLSSQGNAQLHQKTSEHVVAFALSGLRTICLAMAELDEMTFRRWHKAFIRAKLSLASRQAQIARVAEKIEKNLTLLGAAACEDKLQEEVPQTISTLISAGIKVWMLTGDKQETAINIGYSTKLLTNDSTLFILDSEDIGQLGSDCVTISQKMSNTKKSVLVVNGQSLAMLLKSNYAEYFITLSMNCESVICCRMIPIQKARIVSYVQNRTNGVTLAIGDGANDVAMIQAASVGVGISGVEGLQAVYAADYSISVFKHLSRLLLIHGTWNYDRVCKLIYYIYYKNIPLCLTLFYISYVSGWSGSSLIDDWSFTLYNVAFTDGATMVLGVFEKNYPEQVLLAEPAIYRRNNWFGVSSFYLCLLNGVLHGVLLLILTFSICGKNSLWKQSYTDSYVVQGNILYTNTLVVVTAKCFVHLTNWYWLSICGGLMTSFLWFPVLWVYNYFWSELHLDPDLAGVTVMLFSTPVFWLTIVLVPFSVLFVDIVVISFNRTFGLYKTFIS